jgi:hypothetical protein
VSPSGRVIHIHADAPPKPAFGAPCNGCGVCCAAEPCPIGVLVSLRRRGRCKALSWSDEETRYVCGVMAAARRPLLKRLVARWIAAGQGCDCALEATGKP